MKIALAGNPNCGKTTLFNALSGSTQYVGNWPGVTVEKKESRLKAHKDIVIVDLPGIYSLSPYSMEEVVARDFLVEEKPDLIINIIDASNLERNLYLTTQLAETGIPMIIALNMMDLIKDKREFIDVPKLSKDLNCPIVEISALKNQGLKELIDLILNHSDKQNEIIKFSVKLHKAIEDVAYLIKDVYPFTSRTYYSIKLLEEDEVILSKTLLKDSQLLKIKEIRDELETEFDDDINGIITNERYEFITKIIGKTSKFAHEKLDVSDRIDRIVTNRFLAIPIFILIMWAVYFIAMQGVGLMGNDWINETLFGEIIPTATNDFLVSMQVSPWLNSLIVDGIIAGVGAVLGFVPQIMVLFFLLSILEDCGYMARVAFIMDRIFRKFGLSGKSFIPMLISTGCGVPGIMASRTMEDERDRKMTIMLTTFIPCSAKLPIFALFAGAIFHDSSWVANSMYFIGLGTVIICGILLKKTKYFGGEAAPFVMELPSYHMPSLKGLLIHMWDRGKSFIKKAGTIILLASIFVWFTMNYNWSFQMVDANNSILADIGNAIAWIFTPLGFGEWRAAVASITGLIAKENIVGTFGILYGVSEVAENGQEVWTNIAQQFTPLSAYSFMVFNLLCAPCFAAIGAIRREMGSAKWTLITVGFQCGVAYIWALAIFQIGSLFF